MTLTEAIEQIQREMEYAREVAQTNRENGESAQCRTYARRHSSGLSRGKVMRKVLAIAFVLSMLFVGCSGPENTAKKYLESVKEGDPNTELFSGQDDNEDDVIAPHILLDYEIMSVREEELAGDIVNHNVKVKCDFEGKTGNVIQEIVTITVFRDSITSIR